MNHKTDVRAAKNICVTKTANRTSLNIFPVDVPEVKGQGLTHISLSHEFSYTISHGSAFRISVIGVYTSHYIYCKPFSVRDGRLPINNSVNLA